MLGRRDFLTTAGTTAAAAAAAKTIPSEGGATNKVLGPEMTTVPPNPLAAAGVQAGRRFGTCRVTGVEARPDGAIVVRLADAAESAFDVELLAFDPAAPGVARGGSLAAYVNNHGDGSTATNEEHGLAAMALAGHLARREAEGVVLPALPRLRDRALRAVT